MAHSPVYPTTRRHPTRFCIEIGSLLLPQKRDHSRISELRACPARPWQDTPRTFCPKDHDLLRMGEKIKATDVLLRSTQHPSLPRSCVAQERRSKGSRHY